MKRRENHNNVSIIIISFTCYTIVFVLSVLQDKIWHIFMSRSMMRACTGGAIINPYVPLSNFRKKINSSLSSFFYCPCTAGRTGTGGSENNEKSWRDFCLSTPSFHREMYHIPLLVCFKLSSDIHMVLNNQHIIHFVCGVGSVFSTQDRCQTILREIVKLTIH